MGCSNIFRLQISKSLFLNIPPKLSLFWRKNSIFTSKYVPWSPQHLQNKDTLFFFKKAHQTPNLLILNICYLQKERCSYSCKRWSDAIGTLFQRGIFLPSLCKSLGSGDVGSEQKWKFGIFVIWKCLCVCVAPSPPMSVGKEAQQRCVKCHSSPEPPTMNKD